MTNAQLALIAGILGSLAIICTQIVTLIRTFQNSEKAGAAGVVAKNALDLAVSTNSQHANTATRLADLSARVQKMDGSASATPASGP